MRSSEAKQPIPWRVRQVQKTTNIYYKIKRNLLENNLLSDASDLLKETSDFE